jgi:hypothetical protein
MKPGYQRGTVQQRAEASTGMLMEASRDKTMMSRFNCCAHEEPSELFVRVDDMTAESAQKIAEFVCNEMIKDRWFFNS